MSVQTARLTGSAGDRVEGVLFRIKRTEKPDLDRAEGLGRGYDETSVDVVVGISTLRTTGAARWDRRRDSLPEQAGADALKVEKCLAVSPF
jgi:hypothetical protein